MFIQLQPQYLTIWELELELFAIEHRIILVDNTMVIGTDDNEVRGVVVLRTGEVVNVVGFHYQGVVFITHLFACHLATVVVKLFQLITNRAVNLTNFLQASYLFETSTLVFTRFKGFKVKFRHRAYFSLHFFLECRCDAISHKDVR